MFRSYDYEFKEERHSLHHEHRSSWSTNNNYPSYDQNRYYVPPPTNTMHKIVHYEPSDDEDDHNHDQIAAINDVYDDDKRRWVHHGRPHDDDGNHGWYGTNHAISHQAKNYPKNNYKHREPLLRPPSHQYRHHPTVIDQGKEASRYGEASRIKNSRNRAMEDYPRKCIHNNYGEDSRVGDDYGNAGIVGDHLKSLIKGLNGNNVKKIEVIEYERTTYKGAREEWRMLGGGNDNAHAPTNYPTNSHFFGNYPNYPKSNAPRVKGF